MMILFNKYIIILHYIIYSFTQYDFIWGSVRIVIVFDHQGCFYFIQNTIKAVIFWNIITVLDNCLLFKYLSE